MEPIELWIYRALIVAIIGFAIWVGQKLINKVEKLTENIGSLTTILTVQDKDLKNFRSNCNKREAEVNRRFGEHEVKIEDHEERIRTLEQ